MVRLAISMCNRSTMRPSSWIAPRETFSGRLNAAGAAGLARETVRFTRDVREGMELYMARHSEPPGSTLDTDHDPRSKDGR